MRSRTQAINALRALVVTAPPSSASSSETGQKPGWSAPPPPSSRARSPPTSGRHARPGGPGYQALSAELAWVSEELDRLSRAAAPGLVARFGIGPTAPGAAVAAGDNPGRLRSDTCFGMLCGASPIPASRARPPGTG